MKKLLCLAAIIGLCLAGPVTASASSMDIGQITCAEMMEMDETDMTILYFWIDGYVSAKSGNTTLDAATVQSDLEALAEVCKKNSKTKLLDLLK